MLYSYIHMATVGIKGLSSSQHTPVSPLAVQCRVCEAALSSPPEFFLLTNSDSNMRRCSCSNSLRDGRCDFRPRPVVLATRTTMNNAVWRWCDDAALVFHAIRTDICIAEKRMHNWTALPRTRGLDQSRQSHVERPTRHWSQDVHLPRSRAHVIYHTVFTLPGTYIHCTNTHSPVNRCAVNNELTLWRPLLPYGYSYKASCARPG